VLDDLSSGSAENLRAATERGTTLIQGDVQDAEALTATMLEAAPEVVFHLAAQIDVRHSVDAPLVDERINVAGTVGVLEASVRAGASRLVFASTGGALYGEAAEVPTGEEATVQPSSPYGQAKYAAEGYCRLYGRLHGLSTISLRLANVYGPRQRSTGEGGVVAIFCRQAREGETPVIYGGEQTRDFVHVSDVARAFLVAAESRAEAAINVGTGRETSVQELLALVRDEAPGRLAEPVVADRRTGEVLRSALLCDRAASILGWQPTVELRTGIRRLLAGA
jgi:UDP-glucose 4-epimerase